MWNLGFDELLDSLFSTAMAVSGYADDACAIFTGDTPQQAWSKAQAALGRAERWARRHGLAFCPKKSEYLIFKWGKWKVDIPHLTIGGNPISRVSSAKYLGVTINDSLKWMQHITDKATKARFLLMRATSAFGKIWGPSPKLIKWTYEAVVLPKVLYACHLWHNILGTQYLRNKWAKLSRLALLAMAPCRIHTPTAGMEVVLGILPAHLRAWGKNLMTMLRLTGYQTNVPLSGHLADIRTDYENLGVGSFELDQIPPVRAGLPLHRTYTEKPPPDPPITPWVRVEGDDYLREIDNCPFPSVSIYTYGSKTDEEKEWGTGSGLAVYGTHKAKDSDPIHTVAVSLCHGNTVFMAEVKAIHKALLTYHGLRVSVHIPRPPALYLWSDSMAAILALQARQIFSKTVLECRKLLDLTAAFVPTILSWTKAHVGNPGNEMADRLAKTGTTMERPEGPYPFDRVPTSFIKGRIKEAVSDRWTQYWVNLDSCRQTKIWFPEPDTKKSKAILALDRLAIGRLIRWYTGHNFTRRHQHIIDPDLYQTNVCRLCLHGVESAEHLLTDCPILEHSRNYYLLFNQLDTILDINPQYLADFIKDVLEGLEDQSDKPPPISIHDRGRNLVPLQIQPVAFQFSPDTSISSE